MSDLAAIVERLTDAGAEPAVAASCVVEAYEVGRSAVDGVSADVHGQSADARRQRDRERKRAIRARAKETRANQPLSTKSPEANDAGVTSAAPQNVCGQSADIADKRCDLSSFLTEDNKGIREVSKKEAESEIVAPAKRGSRLRSGATLSDADRQFAVDHGCPNPEAVWAEFLDYWCAVPGQRGTKLDWSATWRNRIRDKFTRTGGQPNAATRKRNPFGSLDEAIARAEEAERRDAQIGQDPIRLLSHR